MQRDCAHHLISNRAPIQGQLLSDETREGILGHCFFLFIGQEHMMPGAFRGPREPAHASCFIALIW